MTEVIRAPFTPRQVELLNGWQRTPWVHPFTCGRRGESDHRVWDGDKGTLLATEDGWVCRDCDYTQDWAHRMMVGPLPHDPFAVLREDR